MTQFKQISAGPSAGQLAAYNYLKKESLDLCGLLFEHFEGLVEANIDLPNKIKTRFIQALIAESEIPRSKLEDWVGYINTGQLTTYDVAFVLLDLYYPMKVINKGIQRFPEPIARERTARESFLAAFDFYAKYNPCPMQPHDFISQVSRSIDHSIPETSDIPIESLSSWFYEQTGEVMPHQRANFEAALDMVRFPVEIQHTGMGIYVGQTPRENPDYFWEAVRYLRDNGPAGKSTAVRLVSLEANPTVEVLHLQYRFAGLDEDELEERLISRQISDPRYWGNPIATDTYSRDIRTDRVEIGTDRMAVDIHHIGNWPDGSIPETHLDVIARLAVRIAHGVSLGDSITFIHCRAGMGRAGVFRVAVDYAVRLLQKEPEMSPALLLRDYRCRYRYGVQTMLQMAYLSDLCEEIKAQIHPV